MTEWSDQSPPQQPAAQYRLIRTPPFKPIRLLILSGKPLGCKTHYFRGRTAPCEGDACEACQQGLPWRWHAYLAVLALPNREKCILEMTAQATEQLQPAIHELGTLRGSIIITERPAKRPNGRVRVTMTRDRQPEASMPQPPNIIACMQHIWGLDDRPLTTRPGKLGTNRLEVGDPLGPFERADAEGNGKPPSPARS